jgi:hypothetical protein
MAMPPWGLGGNVLIQIAQWLCIQRKLNQHKPASNLDQTGNKSPSCTRQKCASNLLQAFKLLQAYCNMHPIAMFPIWKELNGVDFKRSQKSQWQCSMRLMDQWLCIHWQGEISTHLPLNQPGLKPAANSFHAHFRNVVRPASNLLQ